MKLLWQLIQVYIYHHTQDISYFKTLTFGLTSDKSLYSLVLFQDLALQVFRLRILLASSLQQLKHAL